jgi:hypothetical protein
MKIRRLALVCALAAPTICCAATALNDAAQRQLVSKYETSPILFVENRGQAPQGVDFVSSGLGRRVLTRASGVDIYVAGSAPHKVRTVSIGFDNANKSARAEAAEPTETRSGFLYNGQLVEGLVDYGKVKYQNVWPGIDVVYYGNGYELEYDFVLQPGADLGKVKLHFGGIDSLRANASGDIVLNVAGREMIQHRPRIYQLAGDRQVEITGRYRISRNRSVTLETAKYDRNKALVIDPVITYHDSQVDPTVVNANGIAVDSNGNAFITGETFGIGMDGQSSLYLLKLNSAGGKVGSTFEAGGTNAGNTIGNAVTVDSAGNVYVVGQTQATGLINTTDCPTCGIEPNFSGGWDAFLVAFTNSIGVSYVTYLGGSGNDIATSVAASSPSAVYVSGYTTSTNFPVTSGTLLGTQNAFLMKIDTTVTEGTGARVWGLYVGGNGTDTSYGLAIDGSGNSYLAGSTTSTFASFVPAPSGSALGFNTTRSVNTDGYLAKINSTGTGSLYFTYFTDGPSAAVATVGSTAYVAGTAGSALQNITANPYQLSFGGGTSDAYLFRVDTTQSGSSSLIYSTYLGGSGNDQASGVAADSNGHAYVVGFTSGSFPVKDAIQSEFGGGTESPFYAVFNTNLTGAASLLSSTYLDRSSTLSEASAIALLGTTAYISVLGNNSEAFKISPGALQDFDQNNVPDLVWYSPSAHEAIVHYYSGTGGATDGSYAFLNRTVAAGWNLVGMGDFDGNGVPDLVWQNASTRQVVVHYYGGTGGAVYQGWNWLQQADVSGWHVAAVADFDGNGVPDLVWQNDSTGQVNVHYYGGAGGITYLGFKWLETSPTALIGWSVVGAADFDGNGVPDLVFQNNSSREVVAHYFSGVGGATYVTFAELDPGVAGWTVTKVADFNGDGVPDLVWQNDSTKQVVVHYYGGANGAVYQTWNWLQQPIVGGDWQAH